MARSTARCVLPTLPLEVLLEIFDWLDPIYSTCLGLTCKALYSVYRRKHKSPVDLREKEDWDDVMLRIEIRDKRMAYRSGSLADFLQLSLPAGWIYVASHNIFVQGYEALKKIAAGGKYLGGRVFIGLSSIYSKTHQGWAVDIMKELVEAREVKLMRKDICAALIVLQLVEQPWAKEFIEEVCESFTHSSRLAKLNRHIKEYRHAVRPSWQYTLLAALRKAKAAAANRNRLAKLRKKQTQEPRIKSREATGLGEQGRDLGKGRRTSCKLQNSRSFNRGHGRSSTTNGTMDNFL